MNIREVARAALAFRTKLDRMKAANSLDGFEWYRYDSLSNFIHLEQLLTGENRDLRHLLTDKPVLDIGCADGDVAFFLESLGCAVTAIDYAPTNHNHMAGVRKLKEVLNSKIEILAMDVDNQFTLPPKDFGLALILGALYHLKNPLYLLETVSKHARYTVVSTRIAKHVPAVSAAVNQVSLAYLLGDRECNGDNSNFWIFTEAGFRQMLARTNWDVVDLATFGDTQASDPVNAAHDERVFCLARSRYAMANVELLNGWHDAEGAGWRWTEQRFAIRIRVPQGASRSALHMKLYLTPETMAQWGSLTVSSSAAPAVTYRESGFVETSFDLGQQDAGEREIQFTLDHALAPDVSDDRERGIIVHSFAVT